MRGRDDDDASVCVVVAPNETPLVADRVGSNEPTAESPASARRWLRFFTANAAGGKIKLPGMIAGTWQLCARFTWRYKQIATKRQKPIL